VQLRVFSPDVKKRWAMSTTTLSLPEMKVDQAWCSELCRKKVSTAVIAKYPCKQRFARIDVFPLYADDPQRYYRVILWVNDWSTEALGPVKVIWKTFYVTVEGIERKIVSIKEGRNKKLGIGDNGRKFMEELRRSEA
jgi:hypothetical protein